MNWYYNEPIPLSRWYKNDGHHEWTHFVRQRDQIAGADRVKRVFCSRLKAVNIRNCGQIIAQIPSCLFRIYHDWPFLVFIPIPLRFFRVCERRLLALVACTTCRWPMEGWRPTVWNWKLIHSSEYFKCDRDSIFWVVVSNILFVHLYLGKILILQTNGSIVTKICRIDWICIYIYIRVIYIYINMYFFMYLYRPLCRTPQDSSKRRFVQKST